LEERARVGFAIGGNVAVPHDRLDWVRDCERMQQRAGRNVLRIGEGFEVRSFELDADRVVIAALPSPKGRSTGMPCAVEAGHKLDAAPAAVDQEVRRHLRSGDARKKPLISSKLAHEEALDVATAIAARRQTDVVDHDQADVRSLRTGVGVGRPQAVHSTDPSVRRYVQGRVRHARSVIPQAGVRHVATLVCATADSLDVQALHPIAQLPKGDTQELSGRGAVVTGLRQRRANRAPLVFIEERRQ